MLYVKLLKEYGGLSTVNKAINDWIDSAHSRYPGFTVIGVTIQRLVKQTCTDWLCVAVIEYRNDTAIQE